MNEPTVGPGQKTIILWGRDDAFGWAMQAFLNAEEQWEVHKVPRDCGIDLLIEEVSRLAPSAIVLYGKHEPKHASAIAELMGLMPELRVINASLEESLIEVYTKEQARIHEISDLFSYIEHRPANGDARKEMR